MQAKALWYDQRHPLQAQRRTPGPTSIPAALWHPHDHRTSLRISPWQEGLIRGARLEESYDADACCHLQNPHYTQIVLQACLSLNHQKMNAVLDA